MHYRTDMLYNMGLIYMMRRKISLKKLHSLNTKLRKREAAL